MRADEAVKKQLTARLQRLRRRAAEVAAEITMVEQLLADVENRSIDPRMKLRKNGVNKLTIQGGIKRLLAEKGVSMQAKDLLEASRAAEPTLKASTFRSHLKRMVDANLIEHDGSRGRYRLVESVPLGPKEADPPRRRRQFIEWSYK